GGNRDHIPPMRPPTPLGLSKTVTSDALGALVEIGWRLAFLATALPEACSAIRSGSRRSTAAARPGYAAAIPPVARQRRLSYGKKARVAAESASLIGRLGSSASGCPRRRRSMSLASSRFSTEWAHRGPSIMGSEDGVEQSNGRPCR